MDYKKRDQKTLQKRIEAFVKKGKLKYGEDAYDYSLAIKVYKNNRIPVPLICKNKQCEGNEPFYVIPSRHTEKGDNQRGSCPNCYVPKHNIQETRWNPNRLKRATALRDEMVKRHNGKYSYPYIEEEFKNENSRITMVCTECGTEDTRVVAALKKKDRYCGCSVCNKEKKVEKIRQKNHERGKRNKRTAHLPKAYGCIYKITNRINGKFYIGYTTMTAQKRLKAHKDESIRYAKGHSKGKSYLHHAMIHHGLTNFSVEILEESTNISPIALGELEMRYIADLKPHYNVSPGGELANYGKAS